VPHDALEQLLRHADAAAPAPPLLAEVPKRVRRRYQRRRTIKAVATVAVLFAAAPLLVVTMFTRPPQPPTVVINRSQTPAQAPTRADLARLDLQAALHEQTAVQLIQATTAARVQTAPAAVVLDDAVLSHVREQRDRAALTLIYQADQAARQKQTTRAVAAYRRAIELFPKTYAAAVARQRLKEMPT
jgi:hypothetical protein